MHIEAVLWNDVKTVGPHFTLSVEVSFSLTLSHSKIRMTTPTDLKAVAPYLARAKELTVAEPVIAYWCKDRDWM